MICNVVKYSRGRIWCPKGFNVIYPPKSLEKYEFGEEISEEETYKIISGTFDENDMVSDEIVKDIFTSLDEFSEFKDNQEFPINFNATRSRGSDTISNNLFTSSSHYVKKSQANIQTVQMRGMGIDTDNSLEIENSKFKSSPKNCIKDKRICGDSEGLKTDEFENVGSKRKWDDIDNGNNIMLRRLQEMAFGGTLETQMFEPGLEKELEFGPLSGTYTGNYGNVFGKETEEEILISGNLGQLMGNDQATTAPLLRYIEKMAPATKEPACSLVVAVHSTNCTPLQCKSPFLKDINHILRDWAVFVLQADPDSGSNLIPNGKDLPFTNAG